MKAIFKLGLLALLFTGCAKIPAGSVALADALQTEGERMHTINLHLINRLFSDKRMAIDRFIYADYTPVVAANLVNNPKFKTDDFKKDFPEMVQALLPEINARRDSLVKVLDLQKEKILDKLNTDYKAFNTASIALKLLLESATKVTKEKQALFEQVKTLSNNKLDLIGIENALDGFVNSAGKVGGKVVDVNSMINQILTNK